MFKKKSIIIASDHAGYKLKEFLKEYLEKNKYEVLDCGTDSEESVDYPDYAHQLCGYIKLNKAEKGVLICGSGIGMSIAANRHKEIRAAVCNNVKMAELSRKDNDANVLALGGKLTNPDKAKEILDTFLKVDFEGGRHKKRIKKI